MTGIKEFFQGLVADGVVSQEPVNYDAATLKIYIAHLEAENAELRERMEKAAEEVDKVKKIIEPTVYTSFCGFVVRWCTLMEHKELYGTQEAAEAKLKELKENGGRE